MSQSQNQLQASQGINTPESAVEDVEAGVPLEASLKPVDGQKGDEIQDVDLAFGALHDGEGVADPQNAQDIVAATYNQREPINKRAFILASMAFILLAAAGALMGVFIPPAIQSKSKDGGGSSTPVSCDPSGGCLSDANQLSTCLSQVSINTNVSFQFSSLSLCPGTFSLEQPLQMPSASDASGLMIVQISCSQPSDFVQGSPCVLEAPPNQNVFVDVPVDMGSLTTSGPAFNSTSSLLMTFVDISFTRPVSDDGLPGEFLAQGASLDFLNCFFMDTPTGFQLDTRNATFTGAHVIRSGSPIYDARPASAMKFVMYDDVSNSTDLVSPLFSRVSFSTSFFEDNACDSLLDLTVEATRFGGGPLLESSNFRNNQVTNLISVREALLPQFGPPVTSRPYSLEMCNFVNNTSTGAALSFDNNGASVTIRTCSFQNNTGAQLKISNGTSTSLEFSDFTGNQALDAGDMLDITSRQINLDTLVVDENDYDTILSLQPPVSVSGDAGTKAACQDCVFTSNKATSEVLVTSSFADADFTGAQFVNNMVEQSVVRSVMGDMFLCKDCLFQENLQVNQTGQGDDAIVFLMGLGRLERCVFESNTFERAVTAIGSSDRPLMVVESCFTNNTFAGDSIVTYDYTPSNQILGILTQSNSLQSNIFTVDTSGTAPCSGVLHGTQGGVGTCAPITGVTCAASP